MKESNSSISPASNDDNHNRIVNTRKAYEDELIPNIKIFDLPILNNYEHLFDFNQHAKQIKKAKYAEYLIPSIKLNDIKAKIDYLITSVEKKQNCK